MVATMNAATFMGKIQNSIMNSRDLTLKHMFDITSKLVSEQEEMNNLDNRGISLTLRTRNSKKPSRMRVRSWKHQSLLLCLVKL